MKSRLYLLVGGLVVGALLLSACGGGDQLPDENTQNQQDIQAEIVPKIQVSDQESDGESVTIDRVTAADPGWVVIHINDGGAPGAVIGHAQVEAGENNQVHVDIDPEGAAPQLFAMLHLDAGTPGEYEFPGDDVPVKAGDAIVNVPFTVALPEVEPSVSVSDQDASSGQVTIDEVVAADPGWLVVHITANGATGPVIGHAQVQAGRNQNVTVDIDLEQATPQLFAMLHLDAGAPGEYEFPGDDVPVKVGDAIVNVPFTAALPDYTPSVSVSDQETSGTVVIDEIKAAQAGWMVIHIENQGAPGPVIGYAPVAVGLNTALEVEIDLSQATDTLFAMLHLDAGAPGEYEFPGDDVPVRVGDAVLVVPFNITKPEGSAADPVSIEIKGSAFSKSSLAIPAGTTVIWNNADPLSHTVTADDGSFNSGPLGNGGTFEFTFTEPGTFDYHCAFHGGSGGTGMSATITVTGA